MDLHEALADAFPGFDDAAIDGLLERAERRDLRRGDVLFRTGEPASELFVVLSGRVALFRRSPDGRESVLAFFLPGTPFGEMPLFDGLERSAGARATEPTTVLAIPYEPVHAVYRDEPDLLWRMLEVICRRLRHTNSELADSMFLDVPGRTAKRLLELAGDEDEFTLPITQEELAGRVGASRERVNKAIASFVRLGWLDQSERQYRILERTKLRQRAS